MKYLAVDGYFFCVKTNVHIESGRKKDSDIAESFQSNYRQAAALIPALVPK